MMDEVLIKPADWDKAAEYLMKRQSDAIWERMSLKGKDKYRRQVEEVLRLCGINLPGSNG